MREIPSRERSELFEPCSKATAKLYVYYMYMLYSNLCPTSHPPLFIGMDHDLDVQFNGWLGQVGDCRGCQAHNDDELGQVIMK